MVDENKENINKSKSEDAKKVTSKSNDGSLEKKIVLNKLKTSNNEVDVFTLKYGHIRLCK